MGELHDISAIWAPLRRVEYKEVTRHRIFGQRADTPKERRWAIYLDYMFRE